MGARVFIFDKAAFPDSLLENWFDIFLLALKNLLRVNFCDTFVL